MPKFHTGLRLLRRIGGFVDQRLGLQENFLGLHSRIAAAGDHRLAKQHDQFKRLVRPCLMIGKRLEQLSARFKWPMASSLAERWIARSPAF